jgi:hypothetical protein
VKTLLTAAAIWVHLACISQAGAGQIGPSRYDEVRDIYLNLRQLPESERQEQAAQKVDLLTPLLATSDESTVSYVADVLRLAGCRAAPALPEMKAALSRFRGPEGPRDDLLSYVVPAGAWGALYNAILMIESDRQCDAAPQGRSPL